jgi:hypothetical protein
VKIEDIKAQLLPDPLADAMELNSAQVEFLLLAPMILALVEAVNKEFYDPDNGAMSDTEAALRAFNAKLESM